MDLLRQRVKVRMEDAPETISVFPNTDIAILRNGKAKKNDPPIPTDLAPISGSGKRVRKEAEEEKLLLEPIRFRYSTEKVVEEPETPQVEEPAAEEVKEAGESKSRSRRRRRGKGESKNQEQPKEAAPKEAQPKEQPAPKEPAEEGVSEAEGAKKSSRRRNHYRRRKTKQQATE